MSEFVWDVRVYYEDTDAAGVVYHSNYLKYMERARTEWLREAGISQGRLREETGALIVIGELDMQFIRPARLDDLLQVYSEITKLSGASFGVRQWINRGGELLCRARLKGVCLDAESFKPRRLPEQLKQGFEHVN